MNDIKLDPEFVKYVKALDPNVPARLGNKELTPEEVRELKRMLQIPGVAQMFKPEQPMRLRFRRRHWWQFWMSDFWKCSECEQSITGKSLSCPACGKQFHGTVDYNSIFFGTVKRGL